MVGMCISAINKGEVNTPKIALGNLAANSVTPKTLIDSDCNQKNNGGFSMNGSKLI